MSAIITSNITSGFIDLATFDEIEKYMYGGPDATAYFVRETRKSTWFTQVPVVLSKAAGSANWNQNWSVNISRAGDYLLQTWLRVDIPSVTLSTSAQSIGLRWTRNLMHNLVRECSITFNDLVAARFDNYFLDFWTAFTVPASKRDGYDQMIGNGYYYTSGTDFGDSLITPHAPLSALPAASLYLPLPFFFSRDSGVALPTAALPYNEMRINFIFRNYTDLLIVNTAANLTGIPLNSTYTLTSTPADLVTSVWANYAIVSNDERKRMACAPRDILIEQFQTIPRNDFVPDSTATKYDIRFSHAIKVLFFSVRNISCSSEWSNYSTMSPNIITAPNFSFRVGYDPLKNLTVIYENTPRLYEMSPEYYSLVNPFYEAPTIPLFSSVPFVYNNNGATPGSSFGSGLPMIGYHSYSYSLDFYCVDPMGSTNYGKLTNVSVVAASSTSANTTSLPGQGPSYKTSQTFEFIMTAVNNNIVRISGGALGFPVL